MPNSRNPAVPDEIYVKLSIASWVRGYLDKRKGDLTHEAFAKKAGVSGATISNIYDGAHLPGFKLLVGLEFGVGADLFEVLRYPHDRRAGAALPPTKGRKG